MTPALHIRWLGSVRYRDALALQRGLFSRSPDNHLLLLEHPHVYTLGAHADLRHVLVDPASVGADLERADRGGDVTYHGPGQLVGYPIVWVDGKRGGGMADTVAYVRSVEQLVIDTLADVGLPGAGRLADYPGVWIDPDGPNPRKIAAVGIKLTRGRSMHGFALNVAPDPAYFGYIVPCGIADKPVTSVAAEGCAASMADVVEAVTSRARTLWGNGVADTRADHVWRTTPDDLSRVQPWRGPGYARRSRRQHLRRPGGARPTSRGCVSPPAGTVGRSGRGRRPPDRHP